VAGPSTDNTACVRSFTELDASSKLVDATAGGTEVTDALDDAIGNGNTAGTLPVEDND